jgi:hypothetical protein
MVNELEAATCLDVLSRRRTLTELDAARALSSAARLLASDPFAPSTPVRKRRQPARRGLTALLARPSGAGRVAEVAD